MFDDAPIPWSRATIHRGRLTLNPWSPHLVRHGPAASVLDAPARRGVTFADLTVDGAPHEEELIVDYVRGTRTAENERVLRAWAELVGYRRLWLPDGVHELDPAAAPLGPAATRCRCCGVTWRDDGPGFWQRVRGAGAFPAFCPACGQSLPEWTLDGKGRIAYLDSLVSDA
jgi:hypothetical protein